MSAAERYSGSKAIFLADREYDSYRDSEHVVSFGHYYLICAKDITSRACIAQSLGSYLEGEFDIDVFRMLALK